uniref:Uncharacterized protein n=1 Tax=Rhodococcus sp. NS1 TaxID=402236 RepID=A0A097SR34_9NOCA|nr:hypothetical protein LRS1606.531 [Rhodococcus sp. NS1]
MVTSVVGVRVSVRVITFPVGSVRLSSQYLRSSWRSRWGSWCSIQMWLPPVRPRSGQRVVGSVCRSGRRVRRVPRRSITAAGSGIRAAWWSMSSRGGPTVMRPSKSTATTTVVIGQVSRWRRRMRNPSL